LADLYQAYGGRLERLIRRRIVHPSLVDDALQETLLRAYIKRELHDPERPVWPWLRTVAANVCIELERKERSPLAEASASIAGWREPGSDEHVDRMARQSAIFDAWSHLSARQRRLLRQSQLDHVGHRVLAEREGLSVQALKSAMARARSRFQESYLRAAERVGLLVLARLGTRRLRRFLGGVADHPSFVNFASLGAGIAGIAGVAFAAMFPQPSGVAAAPPIPTTAHLVSTHVAPARPFVPPTAIAVVTPQSGITDPVGTAPSRQPGLAVGTVQARRTGVEHDMVVPIDPDQRHTRGGVDWRCDGTSIVMGIVCPVFMATPLPN
jgi:RNA polymerase sigma factor (sigma-70 family)